MKRAALALAALALVTAAIVVIALVTTSASTTAPARGSVPADDVLEASLRDFDGDIQRTFAHVLAADGVTYRPAKLQIVEGDTLTGCGMTEALIGFYCDVEETIYIDLAFYRQLCERYGRQADAAQAYVLAHEVGHHVQQLFDTHARVAEQSQREPARAKELAAQLERQADCYAGVWAGTTTRRELVASDLDLPFAALSAIASARAGSPEPAPTRFPDDPMSQKHWLRVGIERTSVRACDPF